MTSGSDALLALYEALSVDEQDAAYERIAETRLLRQGAKETELQAHVRSLRRVSEAIGREPGVDEYRLISAKLREEGESVEPFSRLYRFFGQSWPRAREALRLSGETTSRQLEARFRSRRLGKISRYTEKTLRETLERCVEHYKRPPSVAEFDWWRDQQIALALAQGEEEPHLPSNSTYRGRWKTWEAALLHFGYTPEEVALRLEQRDQVFNGSDDPYLPEDLPVAELAGSCEGSGLSVDEAARVRETYAAMPRRTRYVLTVRLGLGVPKQSLREAAEPLALHLTRIQQLQLYAQDALVHAASNGRRTARTGLRAAVVDDLRRRARIDIPEMAPATPS